MPHSQAQPSAANVQLHVLHRRLAVAASYHRLVGKVASSWLTEIPSRAPLSPILLFPCLPTRRSYSARQPTVSRFQRIAASIIHRLVPIIAAASAGSSIIQQRHIDGQLSRESFVIGPISLSAERSRFPELCDRRAIYLEKRLIIRLEDVLVDERPFPNRSSCSIQPHRLPGYVTAAVDY